MAGDIYDVGREDCMTNRGTDSQWTRGQGVIPSEETCIRIR